MSVRKQQILQAAIDIIAEQGYGGLTMRALARASDLKLGALQYHYPTRDDMLRALVAHIAAVYRETFDSMAGNSGSLTISGVLEFVAADPSGGALKEHRLWPQLWAMMQIEPLVAELVEDIYVEYLEILEKLLVAAGSKAPHAEALFLMSVVEGASIFVDSGRRWEKDRETLRATLQGYIRAKYGKNA